MHSGAHVWDPYCGAAPLPAELLGRWNFDPLLLVGMALIAGGLWVNTNHHDPESRPRVAAAGTLAAILFVSPFCALTSALFSARVVHHVLLTAVLAPLIAFSLPNLRLKRTGSLAAWTLLQGVIFWAWHAPALYSQALSSSAIYWLMQSSLLGSSVAFWLALRRAGPIASLSALLATMVQMGLLGALITFAGEQLYKPHFASAVPWGLSALEDQQLAGLIMWAPSAALYLAAALFVAARWLKTEGRLASDA
jgi:putative membrane protein